MARYKVPESWIVDSHARRIEISALGERGYANPRLISGDRLTSATIPGLDVDLSDLFRDLD